MFFHLHLLLLKLIYKVNSQLQSSGFFTLHISRFVDDCFFSYFSHAKQKLSTQRQQDANTLFLLVAPYDLISVTGSSLQEFIQNELCLTHPVVVHRQISNL